MVSMTMAHILISQALEMIPDRIHINISCSPNTLEFLIGEKKRAKTKYDIRHQDERYTANIHVRILQEGSLHMH
jgi:hypothetical protein